MQWQMSTNPCGPSCSVGCWLSLTVKMKNRLVISKSNLHSSVLGQYICKTNRPLVLHSVRCQHKSQPQVHDHVSVLSVICRRHSRWPPKLGFLPYFWIWLLRIGCSSPNSKLWLNSIHWNTSQNKKLKPSSESNFRLVLFSRKQYCSSFRTL